MSTGALTEEVSPYELGARAASLQGRIPLSSFNRLSALIERGADDVRVSLAFSLDEQRRCGIDGDLQVRITTRCLGCLLSVDSDLTAAVHLVLVHTEEEAQALTAVADAVVVPEGAVRLADLLEDDLILSLPEIVCGDVNNCLNRPPMQFGAGQFGEVIEPASPFSGLADLIKGR